MEINPASRVGRQGFDMETLQPIGRVDMRDRQVIPHVSRWGEGRASCDHEIGLLTSVFPQNRRPSFSKTYRWLDIFAMLRKDCSLADLHLLVEVYQEHRARSAGLGFRRRVSRVIRVMGSGARSAWLGFRVAGSAGLWFWVQAPGQRFD